MSDFIYLNNTVFKDDDIIRHYFFLTDKLYLVDELISCYLECIDTSIDHYIECIFDHKIFVQKKIYKYHILKLLSCICCIDNFEIKRKIYDNISQFKKLKHLCCFIEHYINNPFYFNNQIEKKGGKGWSKYLKKNINMWIKSLDFFTSVYYFIYNPSYFSWKLRDIIRCSHIDPSFCDGYTEFLLMKNMRTDNIVKFKNYQKYLSDNQFEYICMISYIKDQPEEDIYSYLPEFNDKFKLITEHFFNYKHVQHLNNHKSITNLLSIMSKIKYDSRGKNKLLKFILNKISIIILDDDQKNNLFKLVKNCFGIRYISSFKGSSYEIFKIIVSINKIDRINEGVIFHLENFLEMNLMKFNPCCKIFSHSINLTSLTNDAILKVMFIIKSINIIENNYFSLNALKSNKIKVPDKFSNYKQFINNVKFKNYSKNKIISGTPADIFIYYIDNMINLNNYMSKIYHESSIFVYLNEDFDGDQMLINDCSNALIIRKFDNLTLSLIYEFIHAHIL